MFSPRGSNRIESLVAASVTLYRDARSTTLPIVSVAAALVREQAVTQTVPGLEKCTARSEEHTSELQSPCNLVCRLLLEKKKKQRRHVSSERHVTRLCLCAPSAPHLR